MFCSSCEPIFRVPAHRWGPNNRSWSSERKLSTKLSTIEQNSHKCLACHASMRRLRRVKVDEGKDPAIEMRYILSTGPTDNNSDLLSLSLDFTPSHIVGTFAKIYLIIEPSRAGGGASRALKRLTSVQTGSDDSLQFLKDCLETCVKTHRGCHGATVPGSWYPTRLVERLDNGEARLIVTDETLPQGPYASLSHRWGGADIIKCTTETIGNLQVGLAISSLPATFRDALHTIGYLGIKYIWIDSLCIIQDSPEDWAREAQTMKRVYQMALVNLAATRSESSDMGMFADRTPGLMSSETFHIENGVVNGDFVAAEAAVESTYWAMEIEEAPLNARGWVLQERLLSCRVAHFASEQVFWDCSELTASETIPSGKQTWPRLWLGGVLGPGRKRDSSLQASVGRDRLGESVGYWSTVVNIYSRCDLTVKTDKFTALAGLAEQFGALSGDEYCCGLWRSFIEYQLCWYSEAGSICNARNDMAPSWSWASVDGPLVTPDVHAYEGYKMVSLARVIGVHTQRKFGFGRGEFYGGRLELQGVLNPVRLDDQLQKPRLVGAGMEHLVSFVLDTEDSSAFKDLYWVPMFQYLDEYDGAPQIMPKHTEVRGILLRLVDKTSGTYARCGHAGVSGRSNVETGDFAQSLLDLWSPDGKSNLPCWDFDIKDGHLINLV